MRFIFVLYGIEEVELLYNDFPVNDIGLIFCFPVKDNDVIDENDIVNISK